MARRNRSDRRGEAYHVYNRGHLKRQLFFEPNDYFGFLELLATAPSREAAGLLAYCVMPNHWHLVLRPETLSAASAYLQWVTATHALRWSRRFRPEMGGAVYQGRFKSVPIVSSLHLLTALRYVEANPVRAHLVEDPGEWPYSSHSREHPACAPPLRPWPIERPRNWAELVRTPQPTHEFATIRGEKGAPGGGDRRTESFVRV